MEVGVGTVITRTRTWTIKETCTVKSVYLLYMSCAILFRLPSTKWRSTRSTYHHHITTLTYVTRTTATTTTGMAFRLCHAAFQTGTHCKHSYTVYIACFPHPLCQIFFLSSELGWGGMKKGRGRRPASLVLHDLFSPGLIFIFFTCVLDGVGPVL